MKRLLSPLALALPAFASCAGSGSSPVPAPADTLPVDTTSLEPPAPAAVAKDADSTWPIVVVQAIASSPSPQQSAQGVAPSSDQLASWKSPAFRRAFERSYIAESDVEPGLTSAQRKVLLKLRDLLAEEKLDKATKLLESNSDETSNALFDFNLANLYFQQDRIDDSLALFQRAVEKFPSFRRAWRQLGVILVREGRTTEGLPALLKVIQLGSNDSIAYGLLGFCYADTGNLIAAESAYRMAVMLDPNTIDWKLQLTRTLFQEKRFAPAISLCDTLIDEQPENADLWLLQANAYLGLGEPQRAIENYELIDRIGKSSAKSLGKLANIYMHEKLYALAVDTYLREFDLASDAPIRDAVQAARILTMNGEFEQTGRLVEGIESSRKDALGDDEHKQLLHVRAQLALARGGGAEEANALEEIVALDPLDGRALIQLGQYAQRTSDPVKAAFYFDRAASIEAFEAEAKVRHAQLFVRMGKSAEALPLLRSAQQIEYHENVQRFLDSLEQRVKSH